MKGETITSYVKKIGLRIFFIVVVFHIHPHAVAQTKAIDKTAAAFELNERMGRGVNIPTIQNMDASHYKIIKDAGFDNVRIPIHPFKEVESEKDFTLKASFLKSLDEAVKNALSNKLIPIIDFHEHHAMQNGPLGTAPKFYAIWQQIAEHYKDSPDEVLFEIANEPNMKPDLWNDLYKMAYRIIRKSNPERILLVGPVYGNQIKYLKDLELPEEDRKIIVTIHYYEPLEFTHQGAEWNEKRKNITGIHWPTEALPAQDVIDDFRTAQEWSQINNRPLHLGEFGVYNKTEMEERARWTEFVAREAEKLGWSWSYWEFNQGFGIYNLNTHQWKEELYRAFIPKN